MELNKIYQGDCLEVLKTIPSESVDMVMTSPPYWALRDYGVEGQLGLEPTFQEYINKLCDIFDEVKRVLKKEGTCWVNMGDTYGGRVGGGGYSDKNTLGTQGNIKGGGWKEQNNKKIDRKIKADKCLLQIPSRFSIEMCNRGWILRNEIIWHKPNCMPSSVKDRFTVDFEKIFFFSKSKKYYFETQYEESNDKGRIEKKNEQKYDWHPMNSASHYGVNPQGRNKRCVWRITTKPYKEAHFATYPEALCETPIKAGCPVSGIVLDPFFGAGTTGLVALKQNKNYIGIELSEEYCKIASERTGAEIITLPSGDNLKGYENKTIQTKM